MPDFSSSSGLGGSVSSALLDRARQRDPLAWERIVRLYAPLIQGWGRSAGLQSQDALDVMQSVLVSVVKNLSRYERKGPGDSFRGWLWTITHRKIQDHFRLLARKGIVRGGSSALRHWSEIPETPPEETSASVRGELGQLRRSALELVRAEFEPRTWTAFWRTVVEEASPEEVARELQVTVWTIYKARSRVLGRLRAEFGDMLRDG